MTPSPEDSPFLTPRRLIYPDAEPVFIVGSVRSGTSITVNAVRDGAGIRGFHEGNVATMVQRMLDQLERHRELMEARGATVGGSRLFERTDSEAFATYVHNYVTALYVKTMGPGRWLDKSPDSYLEAPMIRYCPQLLRAFPKARFIWCVRRGIENVQSRQRKFPDIPFRSYCKSWSDAVRHWIGVRDQLQGRYLEVRQDEIATKPDRVAKALASFLEVGETERRSIEDIFTNKRLEQSQFAQDHRWIGLEETGWSKEEQKLFRDLCSESMEALGYPLEGKTIEGAGPVRLFFPVTQTAVEKANVPDDGEAFRKLDDGGIGLRAGHPAAEVRYRGVPLKGQSRFSARVSVPETARGPVTCIFRVEHTDGRSEVGASEISLAPGATEDWRVDLEPLDGVFDVIIGARSERASEEAGDCRTEWRGSRLENAL